ncbi:MAG: hypothetical protein R3F61_20170 [Myxococcota bacterium]
MSESLAPAEAGSDRSADVHPEGDAERPWLDEALADTPTPHTRVATSRVDAALQSWRTETVERRQAWDAEQEVLAAEQATRRARLTRVSLAGAGVFTVMAAVGVAVALALAPTPAVGALSAAPSASPAATVAPEIPVIGSEGTLEAPETVVEVAASPAALDGLGIVGDAQSWERSGALWILMDYTGDPLDLRWSDASGAEVMEPTPCLNTVGGGVRRCYVGRTAKRVSLALADGAVPGTWTASACRGDTCLPVATYLVE